VPSLHESPDDVVVVAGRLLFAVDGDTWIKNDHFDNTIVLICIFQAKVTVRNINASELTV
jgi:hypothetical protein